MLFVAKLPLCLIWILVIMLRKSNLIVNWPFYIYFVGFFYCWLCCSVLHLSKTTDCKSDWKARADAVKSLWIGGCFSFTLIQMVACGENGYKNVSTTAVISRESHCSAPWPNGYLCLNFISVAQVKGTLYTCWLDLLTIRQRSGAESCSLLFSCWDIRL